MGSGSDVFLGDFVQVGGPIVRETMLFFPILVVLSHDVPDTLLEAGLEC